MPMRSIHITLGFPQPLSSIKGIPSTRPDPFPKADAAIPQGLLGKRIQRINQALPYPDITSSRFISPFVCFLHPLSEQPMYQARAAKRTKTDSDKGKERAMDIDEYES
jgi:hypothetical protein